MLIAKPAGRGRPDLPDEKQPISHARLLQLLSYDPDSGLFTRLKDFGKGRRYKAGEVAGCLDKHEGYVRIKLDGRHYWAHRLAWFYVHGEWPQHDIDHKDQIRHHNWFSNLRAVTRAENLQNQIQATARSKSGVRGVFWDSARCKWRVCISVGNKNKDVGRYDHLHEAVQARADAVKRHHPGSLQ